jgi:hypothetical protein
MFWTLFHLQKREVGITAGIGSGGIYLWQHTFLANDFLMKMIANLGICCSTGVAVISAMIFIGKLLNKAYRWLQRQKPEWF